LKLDIANMLYDTCELIIQTQKSNISKLWIDDSSITSPVTESDFMKNWLDMELTGKVYKEALKYSPENRT
jgi:preprotein translocase subunit SecA